ncbi:hypothetical protein F5Y07DRAFT_405601 [Xylaria sp. FL0933]|nr:hypothetical protein F5Y07DRAFT_405601 [Xylaria sp. FL0933]
MVPSVRQAELEPKCRIASSALHVASSPHSPPNTALNVNASSPNSLFNTIPSEYSLADNSVLLAMEGLINVTSKGVMMGAAIMFTAIHREHTYYNYVTLGLFSLGAMGHIATGLRVTTLVLCLLLAISIPSTLTAVVMFQPGSIPVLGYAPVIIAFVLWIIEDFSHLYPRAFCLIPWWATDIDSECCTPCASSTMVCESTAGVPAPVVPDYPVEDGDEIIPIPKSLLYGHMWNPSQSCVPSSRLSDISLSSSGLDSLPSSWGTLTRLWFPEFPARRQDFDEPSHFVCQEARTV